MTVLYYNIIDFEELDKVLGKIAEDLHVKKSEIKNLIYTNKRFSTHIKKYNEVYGTTQKSLGLALYCHTRNMSHSLCYEIYSRYERNGMYNPLYVEKIEREARQAIDACFKGIIGIEKK